MKKNNIIIISGPTACGKTHLAEQLAQAGSFEIINADIGSLYASLTIGTAKPDWKQSKISHHLFDVFDNPEYFSMVQFRQKVQTLIIQIWDRGNTPIIVGGSTMYIKALLFNLSELPDVKQQAKLLHEQLLQQQVTIQELWNQLQALDPVRAAKIHHNDAYRIVQALAICKVTNQKASNFEQFFDPIAPFFWISCTMDREKLYHRINQRVLDMLDQGWILEVKALQNTPWQDFLVAKKIIGYDVILQYLQGCMQISELEATIAQKTRHYAKRQTIFFKKLQKDTQNALATSNFSGRVHDLDLTLCDVALYIKGLLQEFLQNLK